MKKCKVSSLEFQRFGTQPQCKLESEGECFEKPPQHRGKPLGKVESQVQVHSFKSQYHYTKQKPTSTCVVN